MHPSPDTHRAPPFKDFQLFGQRLGRSQENRKKKACGDGSAKSDLMTFFLAWTANPLQVASVIPSSDALAAMITSELTPQSGPVIELGPGTGVFTRAILARGLAPSDLTLIEYGAEFAVMLQQRFPEARVLRLDAAHLAPARLFEGRPVGAVISGLPLLSMSPRKVMAILAGAFAYMRPGAGFYQFTYGPRCPVPRPILDRLGLKAVCVGRTLRNFPPASVYRLSRRRSVTL